MKKVYAKMLKKFLLSIFIICSSILGMASTYYVSNSGNDSNSGLTAALAWKTLDKVNTITFLAGDQILFQRGSTFYGSITSKRSGIPGNPIIYSAYGTGANPIITGFKTVPTDGWVNKGNNIWESLNPVSTLPNCNMVTINGINTAMGRFPNADASNSGYLTYQTHVSKTSITSSDLNGTTIWTGAEAIIRATNYLMDRSTIVSQNGSTLNFNSALQTEPNNGFGFFIQNDIRTLDQQNEWYYNSTTKKISIYSTSKPLNVNVASLDVLVTILDNYVTYDNLTFTGANSCAIYGWDAQPRHNHISITNCTFNFIGVSAIYTLINYLTIEKNNIIESNCSAISTTYGTHVSIRNNNIQNIGLLQGMRNMAAPYTIANSAIQSETVTNLTLEYNNIKNIGFNGISFYGDTILVKNNYIDTYCAVLDDGGAIYTYTGTGGIPLKAVKITGNLILNGIGAKNGTMSTVASAFGIYLDEQSKNVEVVNNAVANCAAAGIFLNTSAGYINVHDNMVYNANTYQYYSTYWGVGTPPVNNQVKNNIFIAKAAGPLISDNQKCLAFYFVDAKAPALTLASTTLDNNYYARPLADTKVIRLTMPSYNDGFQTLEEWKIFSKQDANSHKSAQTITSESDLHLYYNVKNVPVKFILTEQMIDVKGTKYVDSILLAPYSMAVLMKNQNPVIYSKQYVSICNGSSYKGYTISGTYNEKHTAKSGADSIVIIYLTVNPSYKIEETIYISSGGKYLNWTLPGNYTRNLLTKSGCDSIVITHLNVTTSTVTSVQEVNSTNHDLIVVNIYPNPSQGEFKVEYTDLPANGSHIEIIDLTGKRIQSRQITGNTEEFNLLGQKPGIYFIRSFVGTSEKTYKLLFQN